MSKNDDDPMKKILERRKFIEDEREVEDNPTYCPFCSTYIEVDELEQDEDY